MRLARFALDPACNVLRFEVSMAASNAQFVFAGEGDLADGGGLHGVAATGNGLIAIAA